MTRLLHNHRLLAFALSLALVVACLGVPVLVAPAQQSSGPSTISHGVLVPGIAHALRADDAHLMQRTLAVAAFALMLAFGALLVSAPAISFAPSSAPGSFERPLRI